MSPGMFIVIALVALLVAATGSHLLMKWLMRSTKVAITHTTVGVREDGDVEIMVQVLIDGHWGHIKHRVTHVLAPKLVDEMIETVFLQIQGTSPAPPVRP